MQRRPSKYPNYPRCCDLCGATWDRADLKPIGDGKLACPVDFPGIHDAECRRLVATQKPFPPPIKPRRFPLEPNIISLWEKTDGKILGVILDSKWLPTNGVLNVTTTDASIYAHNTRAVGEAIRYLYDIIQEGKRPPAWIDQGRARITVLANWLLTQQYGCPQSVMPATMVIAGTFGSFSETGIVGWPTRSYSGTAAVCGLALVRAFQLSDPPDNRYRDAARRAATFLRTCQALSQRIQWMGYTCDALGNRLYYGAFIERLYQVGGPWTSLYPNPWIFPPTRPPIFLVEDIANLDFLQALLLADGDRSYSAAAGECVLPTALLLSGMIADAKKFWIEGATDSYYTSPISGFTTTTPMNGFEPFVFMPEPN